MQNMPVYTRYAAIQVMQTRGLLHNDWVTVVQNMRKLRVEDGEKYCDILKPDKGHMYEHHAEVKKYNCGHSSPLASFFSTLQDGSIIGIISVSMLKQPP
jgi:hypothetical protein